MARAAYFCVCLFALLCLATAQDASEQESDPPGYDPQYDPKLNQALGRFMDLVAQHRVVIVGKKGCQTTEKVRAAFVSLNEAPYMIDLNALRPEEAEDDLVMNALKRWLGKWTPPQIFVHGMHYGGAQLTLDNYKNGLLAKDIKEMENL